MRSICSVVKNIKIVTHLKSKQQITAYLEPFTENPTYEDFRFVKLLVVKTNLKSFLF